MKSLLDFPSDVKGLLVMAVDLTSPPPLNHLIGMLHVSNLHLTSFSVPWLFYLFGALVNHCWYGLYTAVCALKKQTLLCVRLVVSQETLTLPFLSILCLHLTISNL